MKAGRIAGIFLSIVIVGALAVGAIGTTTAQSGTTIDYEGETLTLNPAAGQTITGTTDIDSGAELSVRLRSSGSNPFLISESATVTDSGTFKATFNLSENPAGTEFTVQVVHDGEELATANGRIVETTVTATATTTDAPRTTTDSSIPLTTIGVFVGVAVLALGGFVLYSRLDP